MKRFITLILMFATLLTFTQKATAFVNLSENEIDSMVNCAMSMDSNESHMDMSKIECGGDEMPHTMECQSDCDFMTMASVIYFIDHENTANQPQSQLTYQTSISASPYYFPESLYRPPFLN